MSRHPYPGLGQYWNARRGSIGLYHDSFQSRTIRATERVRQDVGGVSGSVGDPIEFDQIGATDSSAPDSVATGLGVDAYVSASKVKRAYARLATPTRRFTAFATAGAGLKFFLAESYYRQGVQIDFITTPALDLSTLTWNNQADLVYESLEGHEKTIDVEYVNSVSDLRNLPQGAEGWCIPFGAYTMPSGDEITGMRWKLTDESALTGFDFIQAQSGVSLSYGKLWL